MLLKQLQYIWISSAPGLTSCVFYALITNGKKCNSWVDTIMFLGNNFFEANFVRSTQTILLRTLLKMLYLYRQPTSDMHHHIMYSRDMHKNNNVNKNSCWILFYTVFFLLFLSSWVNFLFAFSCYLSLCSPDFRDCFITTTISQ